MKLDMDVLAAAKCRVGEEFFLTQLKSRSVTRSTDGWRGREKMAKQTMPPQVLFSYSSTCFYLMTANNSRAGGRWRSKANTGKNKHNKWLQQNRNNSPVDRFHR